MRWPGVFYQFCLDGIWMASTRKERVHRHMGVPIRQGGTLNFTNPAISAILREEIGPFYRTVALGGLPFGAR